MTNQTNSSNYTSLNQVPALSQTRRINLSMSFNSLSLVPYLKSEDNENLLYLSYMMVVRIHRDDLQ